MDQGTAALAVAGITGGVSIISKVISVLNGRKAGKDSQRRRSGDAAYDRAEKQASEYFKRLEEMESDLAELRAKYQQTLDDYDRLMGENRELRNKIQELRVQVNTLKKGQG